MPNPLGRALRAYAADARAAATAAPVEVLLGLLVAVALSLSLRADSGEDDFFRVGASVAIAFPLVFGASVLYLRGVIGAGARWAATAAILAVCAAFGLFWFDPDLNAHDWRWLMLASGSALALALTAALPWKARDRRRSWAFAWRLSERLVGVGAYAVALYGILAGAIQAIISLFDLDKPDHLFGDLAGAVFFALAPLIFVGGIERLTAPPPDGVPTAVSRLGRWLYAPVLIIYLLILYAYAAKVLVTGEFPRNLVSPLVMAAGLIGLIGGVLLEPVHGDEEHRGLSALIRWIPVLLVPLIPLALWALLARLGQYGWTEFRYIRVGIVAVLGVLAVMGSVRRFRGEPPLLSSVPALLAAMLLLGAVGPWSAPAVSRRDQTARLRTALARAKLDPAKLPANPPVTLDSAAYRGVTEGTRYLANAHGRAAVQAVFPRLRDTTIANWDLPEKLGLRRGCGSPAGARYETVNWDGGVPGLIAGTLLQLEPVEKGRVISLPLGGDSVRVWLTADSVLATAPGWRAGTATAVLRDKVLAAATESCGGQQAPKVPLDGGDALLSLRDARGAVRVQVLLRNATLGRAERAATGTTRHLTAIDGFLIVAP
ncbi:DUF4153 domain-containing protein [Longimicrobium terrae]|uniref:Cytochrome bd-type quinol oxidase subunit 2 n=1 Tax=Longimicrobium terrae TaxID=1639882 RepID=A0A841GQD3_9BACT|nr:DUF4153 domain-containing protein [Longimicrobium terrae]MBB4635278.1 cytochrome bd-type quinol oxidase subunit 2 [Longimicrobium terrae]MBB6069672.1 cytochrome bd-type quinol oxidase subunit 2 [Longimicrobium terrae]NNC31117.1 DUF4153 domain-containing protein [Longimicrobium terrae]